MIKNKKLTIILLGFGILYSLISLVNHYLLRTYALDLGAYSNALYDYSHFQWNDSTVFKSIKENLLADHFDLYLIIFSPLSLIFKTYTLLLVQLVFILLGGLGIYKYFVFSYKNEKLAISATLYFFLFYGIYSALAFDYHSNVISASLVPWFFYFLKKKNVLKTSLLLTFIIIGKENISLWMAFICLGMIIEYRKNKYWRNYLFLAFTFCIAYFLLITSVVMPAIANGNEYPHFQYSSLGENYLAAFFHLFQHPIDSFETLFTNHTNDLHGDYLKLELFVIIFFSGLFLLIRKPYYLLMLLPIFGQKLFHDNISMWGIHNQYSIEFAPIMAIGIFSVIGEFSNKKLLRISSFSVIILSLLCTVRVMDSTLIYTNKDKIRVYKASHYSRDYSTKEVRDKLNEIPKDVILSAQSTFVSQLAYRDNIYQFPMIKDAEYIILSINEGSYPLSEENFKVEIQKINESDKWDKEYEKDGFYIYKKSQ